MPARIIHTTEHLFRKIATGDESAFRRLFMDKYNHIYGFVFSVLKVPELAEEVTQDIFLQVWNHRGQLAGVQQPDNWLFIIARNKAYTTFRQHCNEPEWIREAEEWMHPEADGADQRFLLKEMRSLLEEAAAQLPPQQAEVFRLSRLQDMSLDEVAASMGLSKHTVKYHLTKALASIKTFISTRNPDLWLIVCIVFNI